MSRVTAQLIHSYLLSPVTFLLNCWWELHLIIVKEGQSKPLATAGNWRSRGLLNRFSIFSEYWIFLLKPINDFTKLSSAQLCWFRAIGWELVITLCLAFPCRHHQSLSGPQLLKATPQMQPFLKSWVLVFIIRTFSRCNNFFLSFASHCLPFQPLILLIKYKYWVNS